MKKLGFFLAVVLVLGFAFMSCESGSKTFTVKFNANGAIGTVPYPEMIGEGRGIILPTGSELSKAGYALVGWNTKSNGTGTHYRAGYYYTFTENITLYAIWQQINIGEPTGVNAEGTSSSTITVSWDSISGAVEYYVYRSSTATGAFDRVGSGSNIVTTSFTDGVLPGTTYYYRVSAIEYLSAYDYSIIAEGPQSSTVSATTPPYVAPQFVPGYYYATDNYELWSRRIFFDGDSEGGSFYLFESSYTFGSGSHSIESGTYTVSDGTVRAYVTKLSINGGERDLTRSYIYTVLDSSTLSGQGREDGRLWKKWA